jgi:hypothetical protein
MFIEIIIKYIKMISKESFKPKTEIIDISFEEESEIIDLNEELDSKTTFNDDGSKIYGLSKNQVEILNLDKSVKLSSNSSWDSFANCDKTNILIQSKNEFFNLENFNDSKLSDFSTTTFGNMIVEQNVEKDSVIMEKYLISENFDSSFLKSRTQTNEGIKTNPNLLSDSWIESTEKNLNTLINETDNILKLLLVDDTLNDFKNGESMIQSNNLFKKDKLSNWETKSLSKQSMFNHRKLNLQINQLSRKIKHLENKKQKKIQLLHQQENILMKNRNNAF